MTDTITITIPNAQVFGTKVAGEWIPVDLGKLHNSYLVELLRYGTQRKFNDGAKGDDLKQKLEVARLMVKEANDGKELPHRAARASQVDPVQVRARQLANVAIKDAMRAAGLDSKDYLGKTVSDRVAVQDNWIEKNGHLMVTAKEALELEAKAKATAADNVDVAALQALLGGDS